ncbi:hypothetical protein JMG10_03620 [Nostoc ellipsosporum NOK]|nr:hypothetical protein [Nostoc ellipsosporum NOK]
MVMMLVNACAQQPDIQRRKLMLGDTEVWVELSYYSKPGSITAINIHDDECTSVEAARDWLMEKGGLLIRVENAGERLLKFTIGGQEYKIDPNRLYSKEGAAKSLDRFGEVSGEAVEAAFRFGQQLLALVPETTKCLVALHNNTEGGLSVHTYKAGGDAAMDTKEVLHMPEQDPDDFLLTTDSIMYRRLATAGYNVIWQHNEEVRDDGSMSVYFGKRPEVVYVNCETEHGHVEEAGKMLRAIEKVLREN